jgi:hypothetical protein|tara:strand:- start:625 stop:873 length:249 start_codon:yes stop_codon:yes gene_type:complete
MNLNTLKWVSTFFILTGILMAQFKYYPYYIFMHSVGAAGWFAFGYFINDKAIMTNFGLQIPIFASGYLYYHGYIINIFESFN